MAQRLTAPNTKPHNAGKHWRNEFKADLRLPRPPLDEIKLLLANSLEPTICLREKVRSYEIVIEFPAKSRPVPSDMRKHLIRSQPTAGR
jgi:hypothetical protein